MANFLFFFIAITLITFTVGTKILVSKNEKQKQGMVQFFKTIGLIWLGTVLILGGIGVAIWLLFWFINLSPIR